MAGFFAKIRGITGSLFQLGKAGPNLKSNAGATESRNTGDTDYAIHRLADPAGDNDGTSRQFFYIEHANPSDPRVYAWENISLYDAAGATTANEVQYTRVWLPAGRVIVSGRTHVTSGANGARQVQFGIYEQAVPTAVTDPAATTIAAGSNGAALPQATINVASTTGFPASGTIFVTSSGGVQVVTYTGVSGGNQFTGCAGGTGTLSTGGAVSTLRRVANTNASAVTNAFTGVWDVSFTSSYTVTTTGFYWVALQVDSGALNFLISATFRVNSIKRREENPGAFTLPTLAGATTSPQSAVLYAALVE